MQQKCKRKTYYIKNSAQSKFILRFVVISLIGGLAAVTAFNYLAYKKIDSVLYSMRLPSISPGGLLWNEMLYTNIFVIVFTLIVFAITARGLYVRIHGPLKKMTSDINKANAGDLSIPITLRGRDEFQDFAGDLNSMVNSLNQKFLDIKKANEQIIACTASAKQNSDSEKQLGEIEKSISALEKAIGSFKI